MSDATENEIHGDGSGIDLDCDKLNANLIWHNLKRKVYNFHIIVPDVKYLATQKPIFRPILDVVPNMGGTFLIFPL
jgi:hypothetical protein